jgi:hypothetical protein
MVYFMMAVFINHHIFINPSLEIYLSIRYLNYFVFNLLIAFVQKWIKVHEFPLKANHQQSENFGKY